MKLTHQNQNSSDQVIKFSSEILLAASADVDHRLSYLHVFSMGLFFKLDNWLLAAGVSRHFEKIKSLENLQFGSCVSSALQIIAVTICCYAQLFVFIKNRTAKTK